MITSAVGFGETTDWVDCPLLVGDTVTVIGWGEELLVPEAGIVTTAVVEEEEALGPDAETETVPEREGLGLAPYGGMNDKLEGEPGVADPDAVRVTTPVVPDGRPGPGGIV